MHTPLEWAPTTGVVLALLAATTAGHRRSPPRPGEAREPAAAQDAVYPAYYGPPLGDACSGLWPLPQLAHCNGTGAVALLRGGFAFVAGTEAARGSERLRRGFARYHDHIFQPRRPHAQAAAQGGLGWRAAPPCAALPQLVVNIADANETLTMGVDESYELDLRAASCQPGLGSAPASAVLSAETVFGALRGLETFSQLTVRTDAGDNSSVFINSTSVVVRDWPRFAWRGIMVDSSRHWLPLPALRTMVDAIAFNRLNVLHWHISDAQSFPLNVSAYPRLVEGAYGGASSALVYSGDQVRGLVAYAKDRGVRVVPELDSPGHSASWQIGYPDIGVQVPGDWCVAASMCPGGRLAPWWSAACVCPGRRLAPWWGAALQAMLLLIPHPRPATHRRGARVFDEKGLPSLILLALPGARLSAGTLGWWTLQRTPVSSYSPASLASWRPCLRTNLSTSAATRWTLPPSTTHPPSLRELPPGCVPHDGATTPNPLLLIHPHEPPHISRGCVSSCACRSARWPDGSSCPGLMARRALGRASRPAGICDATASPARTLASSPWWRPT